MNNVKLTNNTITIQLTEDIRTLSPFFEQSIDEKEISINLSELKSFNIHDSDIIKHVIYNSINNLETWYTDINDIIECISVLAYFQLEDHRYISLFLKMIGKDEIYF